jgi:hypothetical protein
MSKTYTVKKLGEAEANSIKPIMRVFHHTKVRSSVGMLVIPVVQAVTGPGQMDIICQKVITTPMIIGDMQKITIYNHLDVPVLEDLPYQSSKIVLVPGDVFEISAHLDWST